MDQPPAPLRSAIGSINFGFLAVHDPVLVRLAAQAEDYVFTNPETALFKLCSWVETLAKQIAVTARLPDAGVLDLLGLLSRLVDKSFIPREAADLLRAIRTQSRLASADAQAATGLNAAGVRSLLQRLVAEGHANVEGQKQGTRYVAR